MQNDLKKFDKNGNPLNLIPTANRSNQSNWIAKYYEDPASIEPSAEDIKCELQLQALSDFEPLNFKIDISKFNKEIAAYKDSWRPYLRREGVSNDREGLLLVGMEGDKAEDEASRPAKMREAGRWIYEDEFNVPTQAYNDLTSLHELLTYWNPLGRTFLVKCNPGGWFPPHKDEPLLNRRCFRVAAFIGHNVDHEAFEWVHDGKIQTIKPNRAYYVDTRKTHRTHAWGSDSIHLIMNIPKTWENVIKLMTATRWF